MATLEVKNNFDTKLVQNTLFSKDNISNLNKQILETYNLNDIDKPMKKKIIDILIKNMKTIYKKLDLKKIDNKNFKAIVAQFNKGSIGETGRELSKDEELLQMISPNSSQLKFKRDFNSNPNSGNKIMERPSSASNKNKNEFLYPPDYTKQPDSRFDKLFKPIVDNVNEDYQFNQYQSKEDSGDYSKRFDSLMEERTNESHMSQRPPTPDFLKSVQTSTRTQESFKQSSNKPNNQNMKKGGKPDFTKAIPEDELNTGFLSANDNNDLYDINNIDKPIMLELVEDSRPFDQRLKSLQSERGSVSIKASSEKINFQDPNLMGRDNEIDQIPEYQPKTIEDIKNEKLEDSRRRQLNDRRQLDERQNFDGRTFQEGRGNPEERSNSHLVQLDERKHLEERRNLEERRQLSERKQIEERRILEERKQLDLERKLLELEKKKLEAMRPKINKQIDIKESVRSALNSPTQKSDSPTTRKIDMNKIQNMVKKITEQEDSEEINILKDENEILKKKLSEIDDKTKFDFVKKEIGNEFTKLNERELHVVKKEDELKVLLKKYNYLYGLRHIQMDISPQEASSNYIFEFNKISNITGVKLMSYSIPQPRYNIEENKNNIFKYIFNGETIEVELKTGKYKIEELLYNLTKKTNLIFDLNYEQKVDVKINIKEDSVDNLDVNTFEIVSTPLSKEILGFTSECTNSNNYIADRTWDLRVEDKIYLFLDNIENTLPFAVLYLNNQAVQQFKFEEPIELDKLELTFKDSKGRLYNFYGLSYSINVQLEINDPHF